ncbi:5'-deoxynucleotidase HDDC2 [Ischnura elegans]|uniref:5'-deoxynucleotidase HDDC2 n=1 Tax=Ischnura elegans TaxID=197161 RepID=UPI001ED87400|nr:5'-deoxynucleotidase HDDC2 [Ischnura elegans]
MDLSDTLEFLSLIGKLKHIKRTGWVLRGVNEPEPIAGHMYRMAIMTFLLEKQHNMDKFRCMKLALVHDMAECIVGDITPCCGVDPAEKHRKEVEAMEKLAALVGSSGKDMVELFKEYEDQSTPEAKFVKDLDRFDMILQAFEYEKESKKPRSLQEFFDSTNGKFTHPMIVALAEEVYKQRLEFEGASGEAS